MCGGLTLNKIKMKNLVENMKRSKKIMNGGGKLLELIEDFLYLGAKIGNTEDNISERKSKAWLVCYSLRSVWNLDLRENLKVKTFFIAAVESVLLYGFDTWKVTKKLTQVMDECYTRILRATLNVNQYTRKMKSLELCENLPKDRSKITQRRLRFARHARYHSKLILHSVHLWELVHGYTKRVRPKMTYVDAPSVSHRHRL